MGLLDRFRRRSGSSQALPDLPSSALVYHDAQAFCRTAEELVIVSVDVDAWRAITAAAAAGRTLQLRGPRQRVTILMGSSTLTPVVDPTEGWIIPISEAQRTQISTLTPAPGEYDLGTLAFVVESA
ncbi:hypothetical protein [Corynebacterium uterequi]|uniref:Uncharacterized protein n=1 Tax=Corynebacterium uterequi TaxID=1072256 RepID=A0A0G3HBR2_9CORY|nr:hypothetical protein [Corynebacterium uterequi]AKK10734.1 hypothetical protein CUTER_03630 [Corynebacterium uterequi]